MDLFLSICENVYVLPVLPPPSSALVVSIREYSYHGYNYRIVSMVEIFNFQCERECYGCNFSESTKADKIVEG